MFTGPHLLERGLLDKKNCSTRRNEHKKRKIAQGERSSEGCWTGGKGGPNLAENVFGGGVGGEEKGRRGIRYGGEALSGGTEGSW